MRTFFAISFLCLTCIVSGAQQYIFKPAYKCEINYFKKYGSKEITKLDSFHYAFVIDFDKMTFTDENFTTFPIKEKIWNPEGNFFRFSLGGRPLPFCSFYKLQLDESRNAHSLQGQDKPPGNKSDMSYFKYLNDLKEVEMVLDEHYGSSKLDFSDDRYIRKRQIDSVLNADSQHQSNRVIIQNGMLEWVHGESPNQTIRKFSIQKYQFEKNLIPHRLYSYEIVFFMIEDKDLETYRGYTMDAYLKSDHPFYYFSYSDKDAMHGAYLSKNVKDKTLELYLIKRPPY